MNLIGRLMCGEGLWISEGVRLRVGGSGDFRRNYGTGAEGRLGLKRPRGSNEIEPL